MNNRAFKTVYIYIAIGISWIIFSDHLVNLIPEHASESVRSFYQTIKGLLFISITSVILYFHIKKQQKVLFDSARQYRNLFTGNPNPMWIYDLKTLIFVEANQSALDKYGYSRDEFLGMSFLDIYSEPDKKMAMLNVEKLRSKKEYSGRAKHEKKSGESFVVSVKSHPVEFNKQECVMVQAIDITERVYQQQMLEESYKKEIELNDALATHIELIRKSNEENRRLAEIVDKINNFVVIYGGDGLVTWVNKAFSQFTGYSLSEVAGRNLLTILTGPGTNQATVSLLLESLKRRQPFSTEIVNYNKAGQEYWVQLNISPIYDKNGEFECFISVENLINERKVREQKLERQHQALRELAWMSSHEVRRPVTSILGLISLIRSLENGTERDECIRMLENCSMELDDILKAISRKVNNAEEEEKNIIDQWSAG